MLFYTGNYQSTILGSNCTNCQKLIKSDANLGKYCRYICGKILQFCGTVCTESYENRLILCNFCQKELIDNDYEVMICAHLYLYFLVFILNLNFKGILFFILPNKRL